MEQVGTYKYYAIFKVFRATDGHLELFRTIPPKKKGDPEEIVRIVTQAQDISELKPYLKRRKKEAKYVPDHEKQLSIL